MAGQTGILQYADWGAGAAVQYAVGMVTGGTIGPTHANIQKRRGIGGQTQNSGGLVEVGGSMDFLPQGANCLALIGHAERTFAVTGIPGMTALAIEGGSIGSGSVGYLHTGCYINTMRLSQEMEGALVASMTWLGTTYAVQNTPTATTRQTGLTHEWWASTIIIDTATYDVQSWSVDLNNNLWPYSSLDTKASAKRLPEGIGIGSEAVTCSVVAASDCTALDLDTDDIDVDIDIVITTTNGTETETITLSDMSCESADMAYVAPDGAITWALEFTGKEDATGCIDFDDGT